MDLPSPPEVAVEETMAYPDEADEVIEAVVNPHSDDFDLDFDRADREMEHRPPDDDDEETEDENEDAGAVEAAVMPPNDPFSPGGQTVEAEIVVNSPLKAAAAAANGHTINNNTPEVAPAQATTAAAAAATTKPAATETTQQPPPAASPTNQGNTTTSTPLTATPKINVNFDDDEPQRINTNDIVLVPVNPRMSAYAASVTESGSRTHSQMDRRRRLFAAKSILADDVDNQTRRKRPARKSVGTAGSAGVDKVKWEDLFASPTKVKPMATTATTKNKSSAKAKPKKPAPKKGTKKATKHTAGAGGNSSTTSTNGLPTAKPEEVYRGPPTEDIDGGWPDGWVKTEVLRKSGAYAGNKDRYWFTPGGKKLRSMIEVKKFLTALTENDQQEDVAWKVFRSIKL